MLFIHESFLVYKLDTFKNCKEVKHIIIMIIVIIHIFLSYVMFDQQLQITFKKSSGPTEKIHLPLVTHSSLKINSKNASPSLFANIKNFSHPPPWQKGGGELCRPTQNFLNELWIFRNLENTQKIRLFQHFALNILQSNWLAFSLYLRNKIFFQDIRFVQEYSM